MAGVSRLKRGTAEKVSEAVSSNVADIDMWAAHTHQVVALLLQIQRTGEEKEKAWATVALDAEADAERAVSEHATRKSTALPRRGEQPLGRMATPRPARLTSRRVHVPLEPSWQGSSRASAFINGLLVWFAEEREKNVHAKGTFNTKHRLVSDFTQHFSKHRGRTSRVDAKSAVSYCLGAKVVPVTHAP